MSESDEINRYHEGERRVRDEFFYSQQENRNPQHTPYQVMGLRPTWQSSSTAPFRQQETPPQHAYAQAYPNTFPSTTHYQQPTPIPPYTNTFFQQPFQPPRHHTHPQCGPIQAQTQPHVEPLQTQTQPQVDIQSSQLHETPTIKLKPNCRNNKNWTKEADVQLTIAWCKISTDPAVGVGQKKGKLWDRVLKLFNKLMQDIYRYKPEECSRTENAVENRMSEIKSQVSIWTSIRTQVLSTYRSGWSPEDIENLCYKQFQDDEKKPFKMKECWEILRDHPKWQDFMTTKPVKKNLSHEGPRAKRPFSSLGRQMGESEPNTLPDSIESHSPVTTAPSISENEVVGSGKSMCTPDLDGPASIEMQRPLGMKKSKANNQRQRRLKKHSQSLASVSQSLTSGLMSIQSATTAELEHLTTQNKKRELKDDEILDDMRRKNDREHDLKVTLGCSRLVREGTKLVLERSAICDNLFSAIQKLEQMDPHSLVTSNQKRLYEITKNQVQDLEKQYEASGVMLAKTKAKLHGSSPSIDNIEAVDVMQRRLFDDDDEVDLGENSQRPL